MIATIRGTILAGNRAFAIDGHDIRYVPKLNAFLRKYSEGHKFYLGIDASTTCTGLCLARDDLKLHMLLDFRRHDTSKDRYIDNLKDLLKGLVNGLDMQILIVESPIQQIGNHATKVLNSLAGDIREIVKDTPEFDNIKLFRINPNSWKSFIHKEGTGLDRYNSKRCLAEDLVEKYPIFRPHLKRIGRYDYPAGDYDSFDATGILYFHLYARFTEDGEELNYWEMNANIDSFVAVTQDESVESAIDSFPSGLTKKLGCDVVLYNDNYTYYENIKMASSRKSVVVMDITDNYYIMTQLYWEIAKDLDRTNRTILFILPKNQVSDSIKNLLERKGYSTFEKY